MNWFYTFSDDRIIVILIDVNAQIYTLSTVIWHFIFTRLVLEKNEQKEERQAHWRKQKKIRFEAAGGFYFNIL